jgi:hypothetical protein
MHIQSGRCFSRFTKLLELSPERLMPNTLPSLDAFRAQWLSDVTEGQPSTVQLGHRFAQKLITQWLDVERSSDDIIYCDGSGDGGIDVAILDRADGEIEDGAQGHRWYLVQSKYGSAFQGTASILQEGQKVIETLDGQRQRLSSLAEGLLERLSLFRRQASEQDRIVLVFATPEPLTDPEKRALMDVRAMGRNRLGGLFDVESISIDTIFQRMLEEAQEQERRTRVKLTADVVSAGPDLLVGVTSLLEVYAFLRDYRDITGDLDQIYEKNVRRFLGSRGKVNKAVMQTLKESPERFGLYNNGITIVVTDFDRLAERGLQLVDPYIVNGCQTTRSVWEICHQRLESGGTGTDPELEEWRRQAAGGTVVTKIVKVGAEGEALLQAITRYTNSQNAVRERDFLAITSDFRTWAAQMAERYNVFLETQRGGWDSQKALQRQHPTARQFEESANAFDLLKVYGAGWLGEAGTAFGRNAAFVPNGSVFKRIMNLGEEGEPFGVEDLYAAYRLQGAADEYRFGRGAPQPSRRQTRFLFYMIALDLLRDVYTRIRNAQPSPKDLTRAIIRVFASADDAARRAWLDSAVDVVDEYLTAGEEDSVFNEPAFQNTFNSDLHGILKWEQLGKSEQSTPRLRSLIGDHRRTLGRAGAGQPPPREVIADAAIR